MKTIKAVVFDMDGVLIDAKDWHYEALNKALALFGFGISRYDHLVTYDGLPTRRKLEMLTRERGLPPSLHAFLNELKQIYTMEIVYSRCKPVFQHEYALSNLKADGYKLAVASNSVRNSVEVMMEKAGLSGYLDALLSNEDVQRGKPDPEIYRKSFERLGLAPEECLVVEDNENGVRAAKDAGACLLVVRDVFDVTYEAITERIRQIEQGGSVS
jgi:beta-phosphoglucomutase-like phosphatase (HAD superfamily)